MRWELTAFRRSCASRRSWCGCASLAWRASSATGCSVGKPHDARTRALDRHKQAKRRHECRRGTHECVRHGGEALMSQPVRVSAREGYALWAGGWDTTRSPIVALEERMLLPWL